MARQRLGVHACILDKQCRSLGCRRFFIFTPIGQLIIAISRDNWSQVWLPRSGYQPNLWSPIAWHPYR